MLVTAAATDPTPSAVSSGSASTLGQWPPSASPSAVLSRAADVEDGCFSSLRATISPSSRHACRRVSTASVGKAHSESHAAARSAAVRSLAPGPDAAAMPSAMEWFPRRAAWAASVDRCASADASAATASRNGIAAATAPTSASTIASFGRWFRRSRAKLHSAAHLAMRCRRERWCSTASSTEAEPHSSFAGNAGASEPSDIPEVAPAESVLSAPDRSCTPALTSTSLYRSVSHSRSIRSSSEADRHVSPSSSFDFALPASSPLASAKR
mmetsp:Transcript_39460/g.122058  ORF Transcript_39460/g.122058 Transcript_39460/m.122058 type:complete len:269 (+) Transcript_39460:224-1030(+)